MPVEAQEGTSRRKQQRSCEGIPLVEVLELMFTCTGPLPVNTSRPVPRRPGSGEGDSHSSSSNSSSVGESDQSDDSAASQWEKYVPRKNHRFAKIDKEIFARLEDEEAKRLGLKQVARHKQEEEEKNDHHIVGSYHAANSHSSDAAAVEKERHHNRHRTHTQLFPEEVLVDVNLRAKAIRPDNSKLKFFDHYEEIFPEFQATVPQNEFIEITNIDHKAPYVLTLTDRAARFFCIACIAANRVNDGLDLRISPWPEFPLSPRDVERWMINDQMIRPLVQKFREKLGPISGVLLRTFTEETPIMRLFDESVSERECRLYFTSSIQRLLDNEAELLTPWLLKVTNITQRYCISMFPRSSQPLQTNGTEKQKEALVAYINSNFNGFVEMYVKALVRNYHGPIQDWGVFRGATKPGELIDNITFAYIVWLTGGSPQSLIKFIPKMKQLCYDKAIVFKVDKNAGSQKGSRTKIA